jgi:16S rRNA (cytidine1402-2'-O)-methyltransferase
MPTDRFVFEGFLPARAGARERRLRALSCETRTLVFFEASHRIVACLRDMRHHLGGERRVVLARELTKVFETLHCDSLDAIWRWIEYDTNRGRGEFVVVVEGAQETPSGYLQPKNRQILSVLLSELPIKLAARVAAKLTGEKKNALYELALTLNQAAKKSECHPTKKGQ